MNFSRILDMYNILPYHDIRLRTASAPVERFDTSLRTLVSRMTAAMKHANGMGIAAIQLGIARRVVVVDLPSSGGDSPTVYANPRIVSRSPDSFVSTEGCLSVGPGRAPVSRAATVDVEYQDIEGNVHSVHAEGILSVCLQHEIDHLDGVLFIDRLSPEERLAVLRASVQPQGDAA
jgi:peptide deformylase